MIHIKGYVISICFAILFCVAINILVPSKKYSGIMKIVCGVFVIATIVSPIKQVMNFDLTNTDKYFRNDEFEYSVSNAKEKFDKALLSQGTFEAESEIKENIRLRFGIDAEVSTNQSGITIYLPECDDSMKEKISDYLRNIYSGNEIFVN